jgi:hypothetical protein
LCKSRSASNVALSVIAILLTVAATSRAMGKPQRRPTVPESQKLVVVGKILSIGPAPNRLPGYLDPLQKCDVKVERVLKGLYAHSTMTAMFLILPDMGGVDNSILGLNTDYYKPGFRYIFFLVQPDYPYHNDHTYLASSDESLRIEGYDSQNDITRKTLLAKGINVPLQYVTSKPPLAIGRIRRH